MRFPSKTLSRFRFWFFVITDPFINVCHTILSKRIEGLNQWGGGFHYGSPEGSLSYFVFIFNFSNFVFNFSIFTSPFCLWVEIIVLFFSFVIFELSIFFSLFYLTSLFSVFVFIFALTSPFSIFVFVLIYKLNNTNHANMPFIFYKKFIVQKTKSTYGPRSWGIPPYLAASLAPAPEYVCFLIIISTFKF